MKTLIWILGLSLLWFLVIRLSGLAIIIHELGHALTCSQIGYLKEMRFGIGWAYVKCLVPEEAKGLVWIYSLGGIGAEILFSIILILIPYFSFLGGVFLLNTGINFLLSVYRTDLEVFPYMLHPAFRLAFFLLTFGIFFYSILYSLRSWKSKIKV